MRHEGTFGTNESIVVVSTRQHMLLVISFDVCKEGTLFTQIGLNLLLMAVPHGYMRAQCGLVRKLLVTMWTGKDLRLEPAGFPVPFNACPGGWWVSAAVLPFFCWLEYHLIGRTRVSNKELYKSV